MKSNLERNMQINEEVLLEPRIHWSVYMDSYLVLSIIFAVFCFLIRPLVDNMVVFQKFFWHAEAVVGIIVLLRIFYIWLRCYSVEMIVTNHRVILEVGFFNIQHEELDNRRIEGVEVRQSFFGRLLNYGDIWFSGTGTSKVAFRRVFAPWQVKDMIEEILHTSKSYR